MRLRVKIIVAFLLLAILPLTGIVGYSWLSSRQAFWRAVEAEGRELTEEIQQRMDSMKADFRRSVANLGTAPFAVLAEGELPMPSEEMLEKIERQLVEEAPWLDGFEWVPASPEAPAPPVVIEIERREGVVSEDRAGSEEGGVRLSFRRPAPRPPSPERVEKHQRELETAAEKIEQRIEAVAEQLAEETLRAHNGVDAGESVDFHSALDRALELDVLSTELAQLEAKRAELRVLLGTDFGSVVRSGDRVLGQLYPQISAGEFVRAVLDRTDATGGEIPFAVDMEGRIYTPDGEDEARLALIEETLAACAAAERDSTLVVTEDWMVVSRKDPDSSLVFGIARPIGESLAEMRAAAARNFALGVGMIGLGLLGIVPLSSRMTRRINHLTEHAGRLAAGDLGARSDDGSPDEIGQLARAFDRMAEDLSVHQRRLVEQQLRQRLLESEHRRKSEELEEARRFQLSLLPDRLPEIAGLELGVLMRTATEVGGDYYDFLQVGDELTVAIGDATGHGARAGTMVTAIKSLFTARGAGSEPRDFLAEATRAIKGMRLDRMAMALAVARLTPVIAPDGARRWRLSVSSAAMPPLVVRRGSEGGLEELVMQGLPLGAMEDARYDQLEIELGAGDCVLMMSDGFPELESPDGEVYGYSRVHDFLRRLATGKPPETIERLAQEVDRWTSGRAPADDVTFVVLKVGEGEATGA